MNRELIEKTMQHIVDNPDQHDQESIWGSCGTPGCFVGWAMHFDGVTWEKFNTDIRHGAVEWAAEHLGVTFDDACTIFSSINTVPMLQLMIKDVLNEEPLRNVLDYRRETEA